MKRIGCLLCVVWLLLSVSACAQTDDAYRQGMEQLESGNYAKAYGYFKESADPRAAEELERLVFVPTEEIATASFNDEDNRRQYTYDERGNLIREDSVFEGEERFIEYTYNDKNWLLTVKDNNSTATYAYDEAGNRLTYVREHTEAGVYREEYLYDEQGRLAETLVTFADGQKLRVEPQEEEPPPVAGSGADCTYDEAGRLLTETYANGEARAYTYDEYGNKIGEQYTWNDTKIEWQYKWMLQYYPDGLSEPIKELRDSTVQRQPVA